jgi:hypothetical protein
MRWAATNDRFFEPIGAFSGVMCLSCRRWTATSGPAFQAFAKNMPPGSITGVNLTSVTSFRTRGCDTGSRAAQVAALIRRTSARQPGDLPICGSAGRSQTAANNRKKSENFPENNEVDRF